MKDQTKDPIKDQNEASPRARQRRATLRLTTDAMMVAIYVLLAVYLCVNGKLLQVSLSSLPILLTAFLFGTPDALIVALCGSFLEQVLSPYGLSATTILWMLPVLLLALVAGLLFRLLRRVMDTWQVAMALVVLTAELAFTAANTAALYLDGYIMQYSVTALTVLLPTRILNACARTACTMLLSIALVPPLRRVLGRKGTL